MVDVADDLHFPRMVGAAQRTAVVKLIGWVVGGGDDGSGIANKLTMGVVLVIGRISLS